VKVSTVAKFYAISFSFVGIFWGILILCQVEFPSIIFFLTAYVWHLALVTPGLKEKVMTNNHKFSFLAVIVRMNHYLQIFINLKKIPFSTSFVRAISPVLFTFILFVIGGTGNILFTIMGSFCFELVYLIIKNKTKLYEMAVFNPLEHINDLNIPPAIPNEEISRE
jgi:hypothetical protein